MKKTLSIAFLLLLSILMLILTGCESAADTADENKPENIELMKLEEAVLKCLQA